VEQGANINDSIYLFRYIFMTPLANACKYGHEAIVKYLVEMGTNINQGASLTPLLYACKQGHESILKYLVEQGAELNERKKTSLLIAACKYGHLSIVQYLVESLEVNINGQDFNWRGYTPLIAASENGHEAIVRYLVEHGADTSKESIKNGDSPLTVACKNGHETILRYLVEQGADLNMKNKKGSSPLDSVLEHGKMEGGTTINLLMDCAKDHHTVLQLNRYPLVKTISYIGNSSNRTALFELLMNYAIEQKISNLNLNEIDDNNGEYPLLRLMFCGADIKAVKLLMDYANQFNILLELNKPDFKGCSPLLIRATSSRQVEKVKLLLDYAEDHQIPLHLDKAPYEIQHLISQYAQKHNINI